jgi:hypothetical protein
VHSSGSAALAVGANTVSRRAAEAVARLFRRRTTTTLMIDLVRR